ncbi:MAG: folylpolyglutamate synthase/dihydrofolate synthase family protein [Candidatus Diapherotrites archaeon]
MLESNALNYLNSLDKFGTVFGLERIQRLTELLNFPQNSFSSVHVAGTNGKGSTCSFIASILREAGFNAGLYTSPHLVSFTERIQVNGKKINEKELKTGINKIRKLIAEEQEKNKKFQPTQFEVLTALAFNYFAEKKIDFAVIETGLGGRLDATNVLKPEVAVITNISLEHTKELGNTIKKIVHEKAGIIKQNYVVVTAETKKDALKEIREKCVQEKAKLFELRKHCTWKRKSFSLKGQKFQAKILGKKYNLFIPFLGEHQLQNACTAVLAVKLLKQKIPYKAITEGLQKTRWPARFEVKRKNPLLVLDAAHNPACFKALARTVKEVKKKIKAQKLILVLGVAGDKDIKGICRRIIPPADKIIVTQAKYRGMKAERIAAEVKKYKKNFVVIRSVPKAVKKAINSASEKDFVLVAGSHYVLGEACGHHYTNSFK